MYNARMNSFTLPSTPYIKSIPESAFEALVEEMRHFQNALADDRELGIVANGAGLTLHVEQLRYSGQMIVFDGVDSEGRVASLIQHYTQVNVQMVAVEKLKAEANRIGF